MITEQQLKELEAKLVSDLNAVRRLLARNVDPDMIRVSSLLAEKPAAVERTLFETRSGPPPPRNSHITNSEIRHIVMKFATNFKFSDVKAAVEAQFPNRQLKIFSIPMVLRNLRNENKIKEVAPREGRIGATYAKV